MIRLRPGIAGVGIAALQVLADLQHVADRIELTALADVSEASPGDAITSMIASTLTVVSISIRLKPAARPAVSGPAKTPLVAR